MKNAKVKLAPEMVATFLVSTLTTARANSTTVMIIRPTATSLPRKRKFSGTFHSRPFGCL